MKLLNERQQKAMRRAYKKVLYDIGEQGRFWVSDGRAALALKRRGLIEDHPVKKHPHSGKAYRLTDAGWQYCKAHFGMPKAPGNVEGAGFYASRTAGLKEVAFHPNLNWHSEPNGSHIMRRANQHNYLYIQWVWERRN